VPCAPGANRTTLYLPDCLAPVSVRCSVAQRTCGISNVLWDRMPTTTGLGGSPTDSGSTSCRRRRVRRELPFALLYADFGAKNVGVVLNLSEGGFCVLATLPVEGESSFVVRFRGGRDGGRMEVRGQVVWKSDNKKRAGIKFVGISEPARRQIKKWLSLAPAPKSAVQSAFKPAPKAGPSRTDQLARNTPTAMAERVPSAAEHDFQDPGPNDEGLLADFSPSMGALAGLAIVLLSLLTFGLARLTSAGDKSTGSNDSTALLNTAPAPPADSPNSRSAPSASPKKQSPARSTSDTDYQNQAAAPWAQPSDSSASRILASPTRGADAARESLKPPVRPDHEPDTTAAQQSTSVKNTDSSRSPDSAGPTQTEMPVPSFRRDAIPASGAPPAPSSLNATAGASGADPLSEVRPGAAEPRVANAALAGPAAPTTAASGHLDPSRLIGSVQPVYPPVAKKKHVQGVVELRLVVDTDGSVRSVDVVTGPPLLAQAATDAARQFRYSPALLDGKPIQTIQTADIYFQLSR
jgi:protein TonB